MAVEQARKAEGRTLVQPGLLLKPPREEVKVVDKFKKQGYRIIGNHSAVKICHWTKSALKGGKKCYKRWYGIESHRCIQMTPSVQYCNLMCVFCWRAHTVNRVQPYDGAWDDPEYIIEESIKAQRELLSGFKGNPLVTRERFEEAMVPKHIAISLDGEPSLYPKLAEFIKEATKRGMTTFLVTNGTMPERLRELVEKDAQPTNLYISLYGPDKETHLTVNKPLIPDSWERLIESLRVMREFRSRKVVRLTLVKGPEEGLGSKKWPYNMKDPEKYAELVKIAKPDFVECKGYVHVGESQSRLPKEAMPMLEDLEAFAEELMKLIGFVHVTVDEASRVVLLADPNSHYYKEALERISKEDGAHHADNGYSFDEPQSCTERGH